MLLFSSLVVAMEAVDKSVATGLSDEESGPFAGCLVSAGEELAELPWMVIALLDFLEELMRKTQVVRLKFWLRWAEACVNAYDKLEDN